MKQPRISIITLCWNKSHLIQGFIHTLKARTPREHLQYLELIIVNNGSTDNTHNILERWQAEEDELCSKVYIRNDENKGFSQANNEAVEISQGTHVFFVNNDIIWMGDAYASLMANYRMGWGIMGPHLISHDTGLNMLNGKPVPYIEGWAVFMSKDVMWHLLTENDKIWDEENFPVAFFEDVDLSLRVQLAGMKLIHKPRLPIRHLGSQTTQGNHAFNANERCMKNQRAFRNKWKHLKGDEW